MYLDSIPYFSVGVNFTYKLNTSRIHPNSKKRYQNISPSKNFTVSIRIEPKYFKNMIIFFFKILGGSCQETLAMMKEMTNQFQSLKTTVDKLSTCGNNLLNNNQNNNDNAVEAEDKIRITAFITSHKRIPKNTIISFDSKINDKSNHFNINSGTFVAPRNGNFTFIKHGFKDKNNSPLVIHGTIYSINFQKFPIMLNGTTKELQKGEKVIFSRAYATITLGCTVHEPCSLSILEDTGNPPNNNNRRIFD